MPPASAPARLAARLPTRLRGDPGLQPGRDHRRGDRQRAAPDLAPTSSSSSSTTARPTAPSRPPAPSPTRACASSPRPRNLGAAGARNLGVAEARGTWIAFQDSDDEWLPDKLARQMARLATPAPAGAGDWVACYCGLLTVGALDARPDERTRLRYVPDPSVTPVEGDILEPLLVRNLITTQTLVVRRDLFLALGRFDEETTPIEDWDFAVRLAARGPIAFVDEPLVHQRFSPNSITRWAERRRESQQRLVTKNMALFAGRPHLLAQQYYILAGDSRKAGDLAAARHYLALARRRIPPAPAPGR